MCGIAGAWRAAASPEAPCALELLDGLAHRGPDGKGIWWEDSIVLGHHRLAIHDLSAAGTQPMASDDQRLVLVINGTIHNAAELKADPACAGYPFQGRSDSEVLLPLWRRYGVDVLERLRGPFALAIWDRVDRALWLARDPLGKKPLHWSQMDGGIVFASEMAALLRMLPERRYRIDAAAAYLQAGYVPGNDTVVEGVHKLAPATWMCVDERGVRTTRYWAPPTAADPDLVGARADDALEDALQRAVARRTRTDRQLGVMLSGGLDSAKVLEAATAELGRPLPAFTLGFADSPRHDERSDAAESAAFADATHHTWTFDADAGALLTELVTTTGELLADSSWLPTALICRRAREHAVVLLCGDGGDEILLGYRRHGVARWAQRLHGTGLGRTVATLAPLVPGIRRRQGLAALAGDAPSSLADLVGLMPRGALRQELLPGVLSDPDPLTTTFEGISGPADGAALAGLIDLQTYLPGDLLPKIDRASMLSGVEVWAPFLDPDVIDVALRIPGTTRRGLTRGKRPLLRKLPPAQRARHLRRPKRGFAVPLLDWLQGGAYGRFAEEVLGDIRTPFEGLLPDANAHRLLTRARNGEPALAPLVHACVVLAIFWDAFLRRPA